MTTAAPVVMFYPYQRRWLDDGARFKIGMFARQTGKTFSSSGEIVDDCIRAEIAGTRTRWVILSRGERQAKEAMDEAVKPLTRAFYSVYQQLVAPQFSEDVFRGESGAVYKTLEVSFPGGSRITALPANPDTARGFSANVLLDEFAFHKDSRAIWQALFPVISKPGLKLRVISTPNGKGNKFYELMTGAAGDGWSRHVCDIHQAVAEGCPRDVDELRRALADPDAWAQEYELQWLDEASAWLSYELIASCEADYAGEPSIYAGGDCYVGIDIGRRRDLTVIWVIEQMGDVGVTREVVKLRRASFAEQDAEIDRVMGAYRVRRVCMDQTGLGEKMVEDAQSRHGVDRVEGLLFTGPVKQELAIGLKRSFEDRRVRIPTNRDTRDSLHAVKKIVTAAGNDRFDAERTEKGHADEFWALALAEHARSGPQLEYGYTPVSALNDDPRRERSRPADVLAGRRQGGLW